MPSIDSGSKRMAITVFQQNRNILILYLYLSVEFKAVYQ